MSGRRAPVGIALLLCMILVGLVGAPARAAAPGGPAGERYLALYLPGVYFSQLERKLELGNELAAHLAERLGPSYRLTPRVYATIEAMDADAGHIVLGLLEAPLLAMRLSTLQPVSVSMAAGTGETRLVVLAAPAVKSLAALQKTRLVHAAPLDKPQAFFDHFVFEGELALGPDHMSPARDVASALSLVSLKKADAIILYEDDEALGQNVGLKTLYRTALLPRPTLVAFDRGISTPELGRLREAMSQFHGKAHPNLRQFRYTSDAPYHQLRTRIDSRPRRVPSLVELSEDSMPLPLPHPQGGSQLQVPLSVYAPELGPPPPPPPGSSVPPAR